MTINKIGEALIAHLNQKFNNEFVIYEARFGKGLESRSKECIFRVESKKHPGRIFNAYARKNLFGWNLKKFYYNEESFEYFKRADLMHERMSKILDKYINGEYIIWMTGVFKDTPNTRYAKEQLVYPDETFNIIIDENASVDFDSLKEAFRTAGVLGAIIERAPKEIFVDVKNSYDTHAIVDWMADTVTDEDIERDEKPIEWFFAKEADDTVNQ